MSQTPNGNLHRFLCEYSLPLIFGVVVAMVAANIFPDAYTHFVDAPIYRIFDFPDGADQHLVENDAHTVESDRHHTHPVTTYSSTNKSSTSHGHGTVSPNEEGAGTIHAGHEEHGHGWEHYFTLHFLVNDIFMVFFFGIAAKEITEACLPGGALNPVSKAVNPLCGTIGGVLGPVAVYFGLNALMGRSEWTNGWGIPTATDIALAWLAAKMIFGKGHPAISFLLLLAVADDAIGLGIIAFAYPDPLHPTEWLNALWIVPGIVSAYLMRRMKVQTWIPYIAIGGTFCWWGLFSAHLHPALALVFIVPFIPGPNVDLGLFLERKPEDVHHHSPLEQFEHSLRTYVDYGLFFFAFANAGVSLGGISALTWIVLASLIAGKAIGITACSLAADRAGFRLPEGMNVSQLFVTSVVAGLGLTVALFVSGQAFTDPAIQGAAKMGALLSVLAGVIAFILARALGISPSTAKTPLLASVRLAMLKLPFISQFATMKELSRK